MGQAYFCQSLDRAWSLLYKGVVDFQPFEDFEEASIAEAKGDTAIRAVFEQPSSSVLLKESENEKARVTVASRPLLPKLFAKGSKEEKGKAVRNVHERVENVVEDDTSVYQTPVASVGRAQQAQMRRTSEGANQMVSMKPASCGFLEEDAGTVIPIVRLPDSTEVASSKRASSAARQIVECGTVTAGFLPEQSDAWDTFDRVEHIEEKPADDPEIAVPVRTATEISERAKKVSFKKFT